MSSIQPLKREKNRMGKCYIQTQTSNGKTILATIKINFIPTHSTQLLPLISHFSFARTHSRTVYSTLFLDFFLFSLSLTFFLISFFRENRMIWNFSFQPPLIHFVLQFFIFVFIVCVLNFDKSWNHSTLYLFSSKCFSAIVDGQ